MRNILAICVITLMAGYSAAISQSDDRIHTLPGQPNGVSFAQYAGYVPANEAAGTNLFYWLVEAQKSAHTKPLILWLNGGPGCSSLAYGAAEEIGPFRINPDGASLYFNRYAWNLVANILFLESPAGVGFSYSANTSNYLDGGDTRTAQDALQFLVNWFEGFPQYSGRDFYLVGESYAGHYVPQLAQLVHHRNIDINCNQKINLKGFMVGNPTTDWLYDNLGMVDYYWSHSMISDRTYEAIKKNCDWKNVTTPKQCQDLVNYARDYEIGALDLHSIYTRSCSNATWTNSNTLWMGFDPCTPGYRVKYFNRPDVQRALHANLQPWAPCNYDVFLNWKEWSYTVLPIYKELIEAGLRIWVFSGDQDAVVPVTGTRYWLRSLGLPVLVKWYPWYHRGQVGGWSQVYKGITFATIRGAAHEVPLLQPQRALFLATHFLHDRPLPHS